MMNANHANLYERMYEYKDKVALVDNGISYTYDDLSTLIIKYVKELQENLKLGDRVVLLGDYSLKTLALFFALARLKCIVIPLTTQVEDEITEKSTASCAEWILNTRLDGEKYSVVCLETKKESGAEIIDCLVRRNSSGLILFSSGSTGRPKAMLHDLDNLMNLALSKKSKKLVFMIFLMFDHIGGINTLLSVLAMGAKFVTVPNRSPQIICRLIEENQVNVLPASPTFLNLMLMSDAFGQYNLSSLRMITYGTEPMPDQLLLRIKKAFPKVKLLQTFGTSETGIVQSVSKDSGSTIMRIDDPNTEYKIVDGELWIKSKSQILGYLGAADSENITTDGWFKTGDLVEEFEDGYFRIKGRCKEQINVGGGKFYLLKLKMFCWS